MVNIGYLIPISPKTKRPLERGFFGRDATKRVTNDTFAHYHARCKGYWARRTGRQCNGTFLIVVDCDVKHGVNGPQNWADFMDESEFYPVTLVVGTPSGGCHVYFHASAEIADPEGQFRNRVGVIEGVDIRAQGGFVGVPDDLRIIPEAGAVIPESLKTLALSGGITYEEPPEHERPDDGPLSSH